MMGHNETNSNHSHNSAEGVLAYIIIETLLTFFGFCSNAIVLIAICKFKKLQTRTYRLIGSLAVADLFVALLSGPSGIILRLNLSISPSDHASINQAFCSVLIYSVLIFTQVSIMNMLVIAIERCIAIYHPLRYKVIVSSFRLKLGIVGTWILGAGLANIPHSNWLVAELNSGKLNNTERHCGFEDQIDLKLMVALNFFTFMLLPLLIMFIIYYFIFKSAKSQLRRIYADVRVLDKKKQLSLSSLKDIFYVKDRPSRKKAKKKISFRTTILLRGRKEGGNCDQCKDTNNRYKSSDLQEETTKYQGTNLSQNPKFDSQADLSDSISNVDEIVTSLRDESELESSLTSRGLEENTVTKKYNTFSRKASSVSTVTAGSSLEWTESELQTKKLQRRSNYIKKEFRAARSLFTVVGVFALCWLPLHIHNTLHYFYPSFQQSVLFVDFAILLSHANSLANPVIYAYQLRDMKKAFRQMFSQLFKFLKTLLCCERTLRPSRPRAAP